MDPYLATLNELFTTTYRSVLKVEEVMLRHLSNNSLTLSEMHMLECIGKRAGDVTITDIAQELDVTPPSVTMAVKRLEKKGLSYQGPLRRGRPPRARASYRRRPPRRDGPPLLSPADGARRSRAALEPAQREALLYALQASTNSCARRSKNTTARGGKTHEDTGDRQRPARAHAHQRRSEQVPRYLGRVDPHPHRHPLPAGHHRRDALAARRPRRQRRAGKRRPRRRGHRLYPCIQRPAGHHHPLPRLPFAGGDRRELPGAGRKRSLRGLPLRPRPRRRAHRLPARRSACWWSAPRA